MNILVTGSNGQLGNELRIIAADSRDRYIFTDISDAPGVETVKLDITDAAAVFAMVREKEIDVAVNCAAYTDVEKAEDNPVLCRQLNAAAPATLAGAMKGNGGLLVHISTDYVFGADPYNVPRREDQAGTPAGVYGKTKLEGEQAVIASGCRSIIIRTAWLYSEFGRNFVKTMLSLTASRPELKVVFDQAGTPTYAYDLAKVIYGIIDGRSYAAGIYNYSNEGVCSWYDFAKAVAEYSGHDRCIIYPCHSDEFPSKVVRPAYSVLDKTKIKETFGISVPHWRDSLRTCLQNMGEYALGL
ncbi:MAG: dTDP-4-dehydrorhamnose reductase [Bacteroidales bacterium]|nr:dTDP-4-dehydrorhamnose reductase [Bacteroides sp.]MCM1199407.1 dTDP-4-dehydrorhamnose reductase [Clostridium sp.]MCM1502334.1 dTDP-4-dehydrorhamnose reductase [Bacteroidales bacterium]